jgi:hypothetical protein
VIFFTVLIALASGEFQEADYQFLDPITAIPSVCIVRDIPVDVLSGPKGMQEARCIDADGKLIYAGYVRETSII